MSTLKWKVFCVYEKFSFLLFDKISYKKSFHVPFMGVESVATNKSLWYNAHYHNVVCGVQNCCFGCMMIAIGKNYRNSKSLRKIYLKSLLSHFYKTMRTIVKESILRTLSWIILTIYCGRSETAQNIKNSISRNSLLNLEIR